MSDYNSLKKIFKLEADSYGIFEFNHVINATGCGYKIELSGDLFLYNLENKRGWLMNLDNELWMISFDH